MIHARSLSRLILLAVLSLFLTGCILDKDTSGTPPFTTPVPKSGPVGAGPRVDYDIAKTTCAEIPQARVKVREYYDFSLNLFTRSVKEQRDIVKANRDRCLLEIKSPGSAHNCDDAWHKVQQAQSRAVADISNQSVYQEYQKAKSEWDRCYEKAAGSKEERAANDALTRNCQTIYEREMKRVEQDYQYNVRAIKDRLDADIFYLDALEKKCQQEQVSAKASTGTVKIGVIFYNDHYLPVSQLQKEVGAECNKDEHYHAKSEGTVKALNGDFVYDPGGCGFGKVKDKEVFMIEPPPETK